MEGWLEWKRRNIDPQVKVVKEGKEGMGASSMWVEKGHIRKTEEARVEGGGEDDGVA